MLLYEDIVWTETEDGARGSVYKYFFRDFSSAEIEEELGPYTITDGELHIREYSEERNARKVVQFFRRFKKDLTYKLNGNPAVYVDEDLELPLIGLNFLGILDKGSEILEIKPITNCNADCSFCSVNEGPSSDKEIDFVVDVDYLINETRSLLAFKGAKNMQLWINPHGEPTLYSELGHYCERMLADEHVSKIHIITNGMLLRKPLVDTLYEIAQASGKRIELSVSMSALSTGAEEKSRVNKEGLPLSQLMMGKSYNLSLVLKNLEYAVDKLPMMITPVLVQGMNDNEMKGLIEFSKALSSQSSLEENKEVGIMIQKFCKNKHGRNPVKEGDWDSFFTTLNGLEKDLNVKLTGELGKIQETKQHAIPVEKKKMIKVRVVSPGRYHKNRLGILESEDGDRAVVLFNCRNDKGIVKAKVIQNKYNMIVATC